MPEAESTLGLSNDMNQLQTFRPRLQGLNSCLRPNWQILGPGRRALVSVPSRLPSPTSVDHSGVSPAPHPPPQVGFGCTLYQLLWMTSSLLPAEGCCEALLSACLPLRYLRSPSLTQDTLASGGLETQGLSFFLFVVCCHLIDHQVRRDPGHEDRTHSAASTSIGDKHGAPH